LKELLEAATSTTVPLEDVEFLDGELEGVVD
jgi:hypothetical protein